MRKDHAGAASPLPTNGLPQMISIDELSGILGMSKRTVWRLLSVGRIPEPVRIGGSTRWRLDEVRRWIDSGCPTANNSAHPSASNRLIRRKF